MAKASELFYTEILKKIGAPESENNIKFLKTWQTYEGGTAKSNPLNTTYKYPNATDFNTAKVKNYASDADGQTATAKTLLLSYYKPIVQGLKESKPFSWYHDNEPVNKSIKTWGTHNFAKKLNKTAPPDTIFKPQDVVKIKPNYGGDIGEQHVTDEITSTPPIKKEPEARKALNIVEREAVGIWSIIKLIVDGEVANKTVNDFTISQNQGSLLSFVNMVCQDPWVEFMTDTYGDKYYMIARKPPFMKDAWNSLYTLTIEEQDVISDNFSWYDGDVFSWFQLIPKGNYFGAENQIFQYIPAMFFEEYAEIWGAKPRQEMTNYIEFANATEDKIVEQKAIDDLKFMILTSSYLPFTRKGTITINGDRRFRVGMRIKYNPTGEVFYVDSVSQSFTVSEGGPERLTTLQVSRGMVEEYCLTDINDSTSKNYFNLINFGDYADVNKDVEIKTNLNITYTYYFDNDKSNLIDSTVVPDDKTKLLEAENSSWRKEKHAENNKYINWAAKQLAKFPNLSFEIVGYIDSDSSINNPTLPIRRANTVKNRIISVYKEIYKTDLVNPQRIITKSSVGTASGEKTQVSLALNRKAVLKSLDSVSKSKEPTIGNNKNKNWHVNRNVFQFFLNRRQLPDYNFDKVPEQKSDKNI
jgi:hypothetical protein